MKNLILFCALIIFSAPAQAGILDIKEVTSPGGIKAWLVEEHTIPVVSLKFSFRGAGAANDPINKQGLARLLSNTLDEGAGDLKSEQFQGILDDRSISLGFSAGRDDFSGSVRTLSKNKQEAFNLLQLALTKPRFDKEAVNRMIEGNLARIRSDMTDPDWMSARLLNSVTYKEHPYSMNSGGTLSSLPKITPKDLRDKLQKDLTTDHLIVSVAGDMTEAELATILDQIFGQLPKQSTNTEIGDVTFADTPSVTLYQLDIPQTLIEGVLPGIRMDDPDYFAADIMNFILGSSGFGSRLMDSVREKNGLTYGIYTGMDMLDHAALFNISTSTKNETVSRVLELTKGEFTRIKAEDVTAKEIKDAQSYLIGSVPLSLTSTDQIAATMLTFQRHNLPKNYLDVRAEGLRKVTAADVKRAANRLLDENKLTITLVGSPLDITPTQVVTELPNVK